MRTQSVILACVLTLWSATGCRKHPAHDSSLPADGSGSDQPSATADPERPPVGEPAGPLIVLATFEEPSPVAGKNPRETYEAAKACVGRADYAGVWGLYSKRARGAADGSLPPALGEWRYFDPEGFKKLFGMYTLEFEKLPIWKQYALLSLRNHRANPDGPKRFVESRFAAESVNGEAAFVEYRTPDGETYRLEMLLEDGLWKLARARF